MQRLFDLLRWMCSVWHGLRRLLVMRVELWRMLVVRRLLVMRHSLWRMLVVQHGHFQWLCYARRMCFLRIGSRAVDWRTLDWRTLARSQRHESATGHVFALDRSVGAGDDWPAGLGADGSRFFTRTSQDLRPRRRRGPDLAECARRQFRHVLSPPALQRGEPHRRALADPEHPSRQQRSATEPYAQCASGE
jgi:hypothetical protein